MCCSSQEKISVRRALSQIVIRMARDLTLVKARTGREAIQPPILMCVILGCDLIAVLLESKCILVNARSRPR